MEFNIEKFIKDFIKREVTRLFRIFIQLIEDLVQDGRMSPEEFQSLRKRILDNGNDCIRSIFNEIENFDLIFKKEKENKKNGRER